MPNPDSAPSDDISTEALVEMIRKSILAKDMEVAPGLVDFFSESPAQQLPSELLDHIQEAFYIHDQLRVSIDQRKTGPPIIGPILQWLRRQFHQLVIFYVNEVTTRQIKVNYHLIKAVYLLGQLSVQDSGDQKFELDSTLTKAKSDK